jgi:UDP-N-acetylenolpyruvoylglucosamine reductase
MRGRVRERFGVTLETEVRLVGEFGPDERLD